MSGSTRNEHSPVPGLDFFWEQADVEGSDEHPLERELCHRLDAMERYRQMIMDAQMSGRDDMVDALVMQHEKQARVVRQLRHALYRARGDQGGDFTAKATRDGDSAS